MLVCVASYAEWLVAETSKVVRGVQVAKKVLPRIGGMRDLES
jgi:hypothetical protein